MKKPASELEGMFVPLQSDIVHDLTQALSMYNKSSGDTYVHLYTRPPLAATLHALQAGTTWSPCFGFLWKKLLKAHYGAAACAETACCRRRPSSARWNAPRACATDLAAAPRLKHVMWIRPVPASGTRFMNVPSRWVARKSFMEVLPPLDWEKVGAETWGDVAGQVKQMGTGKVAKGLLIWFNAKNAPRPGMGSSALCASRIGGRAIANTTHRNIPNLSRNWNGDLKRENLSCLRDCPAFVCLDQQADQQH